MINNLYKATYKIATISENEHVIVKEIKILFFKLKVILSRSGYTYRNHIDFIDCYSSIVFKEKKQAEKHLERFLKLKGMLNE